jgi:hypothetical protein
MSNGKKEAGQCWPFLSKWLAMLPIRVLSVRELQIGQRLFMMPPDDAALQDTSVSLGDGEFGADIGRA